MTELLHVGQARLRKHYAERPEAAQITLRACGEVDEGITCRVENVRTTTVAAMHPGVGGSGQGACPGDLLLEALVACAGVTLGAVATGMCIELRSARIQAEGDLDFRGALGLSSEVPVGFRNIRLQFVLDTDASDEILAKLLKRTEACCVVYQTLLRSAPLHTAFARSMGASESR